MLLPPPLPILCVRRVGSDPVDCYDDARNNLTIEPAEIRLASCTNLQVTEKVWLLLGTKIRISGFACAAGMRFLHCIINKTNKFLLC